MCASISSASLIEGSEPRLVNQIMCALRFFYKTTMGIKDAHDHIPLARRSDPLPAILSREEVSCFLQAAYNIKLQNRIRDYLRRGPARLRADLAHHPRHRQRPHGHPRAARQRTQRPLCDAVRSVARSTAVLLEDRIDRPTGCSLAPIRSAILRHASWSGSAARLRKPPV